VDGSPADVQTPAGLVGTTGDYLEFRALLRTPRE